MDALTPPEQAGSRLGNLGDRIAAAEDELQKAAQLGALRNDPLRFVLEGIAAALGVIREVSTSLGVTSQQIAAAMDCVRQPFTQDILGPVQRAAAAGATEEVLAVARAIRRRTAILVGGSLGLAAVVAFVAGYTWGQVNAAASFRVTQAGLSAAFQHGPKDAARWRDLMRWNDIGSALQHCQTFTDQASGRQACMVPLWTAPLQKRVPGA